MEEIRRKDGGTKEERRRKEGWRKDGGKNDGGNMEQFLILKLTCKWHQMGSV